ncbi:hypothetical protein [Planococcus sp. YIM B11945]
MAFMKEAKEKEEVRKKRNRIRLITWIVAALILFAVWYFTK